MLRKLLTTSAIGLAALGTASAAQVAGGQTTITLTATENFGLDSSPLGDAQEFSDAIANQPVYTLMINGDEITAEFDDIDGTITHGEDDGIRLSAGSDFIELTDLVIDFDDDVVFADVSASNGFSGESVGVFVFSLPDELFGDDVFANADLLSGINLSFSEDALNLVTAVFGEFDLNENVPFGNFQTNPSPVPVPAAALLFGPAAAGIFLRGRKRKQQA
jgi:hypothetical protein